MSKFKICIIEDEDSIREVISEDLVDAGFEVVSFSNGSDCIKYLESSLFDICVVDIRLPDIDGLNLIRIIKERIPRVGILTMTAYGSIDTAVEAMRLEPSTI